MKRYFAALVIVLAGLTYLVGYWPEHRRRQALQGQVTSLQVQLAEAQAQARLGGLLGQILAAEDAVSAQNYGQAQTLSSRFFDSVRTEAARTAAGAPRTRSTRSLQCATRSPRASPAPTRRP